MPVTVDIPDGKNYVFKHLVLDFNGTLAVDGRLKPEITPLLLKLAEKLQIHVLTADTFGSAAEQLQGLPLKIAVLSKENQAESKAEYVKRLGNEHTVAIGNGNNDRLMLRQAALGIAVMMEEGAAVSAVTAAEMVCPHITDALQLLIRTKRLIAGLR